MGYFPFYTTGRDQNNLCCKSKISFPTHSTVFGVTISFRQALTVHQTIQSLLEQSTEPYLVFHIY